MEIKKFISTILDENIYLVTNEKKESFVVDPGGENIDELINYIDENELDLKGILITHGHFDHITSIEKIVKKKNIPVYIGEDDKKLLYDSNLSVAQMFMGEDIKISEDIKIITVKNNDIVFGLECISTPGHTKGSTCYYSKDDKIIFTGDTLFKQAYGRTDFPTGNGRELRDSLNLLLNLPGDTIIYPGHGESTSVNAENNFYNSLYY